MPPQSLSYTKEVMKRFQNPKNVKKLKNPDAVGKVGNPKCLLPEEKLYLDGEFKQINESKKEDIVVSHTSSKNKILKIFSRKYNGRIITLKNCLGKISLTPEHLIYALKLPKDYNFLRTKNKKKLIPAWYHAEDLEKKDIAIYPLDKESKNINFLNIEIKKSKYDFRSKILPKKIPLSSDLLRLFGYFISEGNIQDKPSKTFISFSLNINEKEIAEDISNISKKLFGLETKKRENIPENGMIIYIYNAQLARFFKKLFGNDAQHKKFPEFIMKLPPEKQKFLIEGFWKGDGYINLKRDGPRAGYSTISYQLTQQIKCLLLRQKIIPSIYVDKEKVRNGVNHKKSYRIHIGQRESLIKLSSILKKTYSPKSFSSIDSWFDEEFLYTPLTDIKKNNYHGKVFNLEVEKDHSFISEAFSVHNCGDVMKMELNIDEKTQKIKDIGFQTYGCPAAIATSDVVCDLAKGKTIQQAKKITKSDVVKELKNLPAIKLHCSVLGIEALNKAIKEYEEKGKNNF